MNLPASSTMSTEEHYYFSRVLVLRQGTFKPAPGEEDDLPINFYLVKQSRRWDDDDLSHYSVKNSVGTKASTCILFSHRYESQYIQVRTELMSSQLSRMGVPREEQATIFEKLFPEEVQAAVPGARIFVLIVDVNVQLSGSFHDLGNIATLIREDHIVNIAVKHDGLLSLYDIRSVDYHTTMSDTVALESLESYKFEFIPAARSSIEGLQKMRLDSLEDDTIRQNLSCSICMDKYAQGGVDQLITHLPCAHLYHVDCITRWLETSHVCPLCRFPLPRAEDGEPSNL